jgi:hypothetical protein
VEPGSRLNESDNRLVVFLNKNPLERKPASAEVKRRVSNIHLIHAGVVFAGIISLSELGFIAPPFSIVRKIRS